MKTKKHRVFEIIQIGKNYDWESRLFDVFIAVVIVLNISVIFLETFDGMAEYRGIFNVLEIITIAIFCVEYLLRLWTAEYLYPKETKGGAVRKFIFSADGIIDLLTILPFFFLSGAVVFRMLRVFRIFHLFRINAYYDSFNVITTVLYEKRNQIISSLFIIMILAMAASLCMYSAEHEAQPELFSNAFSGIWWSVSAMLTIGYGDIYPVTSLGRVMAIIISFLGVGAVAIPTGIISAGFVEQYTKMQRKTPIDVRVGGMVSVEVTKDSPLAHRTVKDLDETYALGINVIVRDGAVVLPTKKMIVKPGDTIVYREGNMLEHVDDEIG